MNQPNNIKNMFKKSYVNVEPELDQKIMADALSYLEQTTSRISTGHIQWRNIMKSKITKLATAAAAIIIVILVASIFVTSTPMAYALDDTIKANHTVRYLHIKDFMPDHNEPKEFWVNCGAYGEIHAARAHLPAWVSPTDGAKTIVWKQGKIQAYMKKKNFLLIANDQTLVKQMLDMIKQIDPRLLVESAKARAEQGLVDLETHIPTNKSEPIEVIVTYTRSSPDVNHRKILYIDQATKLVSVIESYRLQDGQYKHGGTMELYDYNIAISEDMFTLENEVPSNAIVFDQTKKIGLAQQGMTNEEVAVEVVRQFFEAIIAEDFDAAGKLMEGAPAEFIKQGLAKSKTKYLNIISVGPSEKHPRPATRGILVPCKLEIEKDGNQITYEAKLGVRQVFNQPGQWTIFGGDF